VHDHHNNKESHRISKEKKSNMRGGFGPISEEKMIHFLLTICTRDYQ
jgi:hypothetical protein